MVRPRFSSSPCWRLLPAIALIILVSAEVPAPMEMKTFFFSLATSDIASEVDEVVRSVRVENAGAAVNDAPYPGFEVGVRVLSMT